MPLPSPSRGAALALVALAACGPSDARSRTAAGGDAAAPCPPVDDAVALAVADFIRATKPRPQRFLTAAGTDSALPEKAVLALQDKGPTWFFPADPAQLPQFREMLSDKGPYATLLVVRREARAAGTTASVRLGGHFVGNSQDGTPVAGRRYALTCAAGRWTVTSASEERSA